MVDESAGQLVDATNTINVLTDAARALHGQADLEALVSWAATAGRVLTGATGCAVWLDANEELKGWQGTDHISVGGVGDPRRHRCLLSAVRGDSAVRIDDLADPRVDARLLQAALGDVQSVLGVPVVRRDGVPYGVLLAVHDDAPFTEGGQLALSALGAHLGVALDNHARVAELDKARREQRLVVRELQSAVRPPTPTVPQTELGVFYESADEEAPSGGDLWDWVLLPDGDVHIAVVDVMGKGVEATKDALAVTHALRLLVLDGCPLELLVQRADSIVCAQNPDLVATLIVGRYDPDSGALVLAGAGHPPALIVGPDGVREITAAGIPIGWPGAGSSETVKTHLQRSESLILYTDGLIEARKDIIEGLETLKRFAIETAPYPAAQQARVLVDRVLSDAARRDDSLAVVLRRRTPPTGGSVARLGPFQHRLSRSDASVTMARRLLEDWLEAIPVDDHVVGDLLLVATELCSNAVKHAQWTATGCTLRARTDGNDVLIEVEDDGTGLELPFFEHAPPPAESERGRGLWLVQTLMDDVSVGADRSTVVSARKRAVAAGPPGEEEATDL